MMTYSLRWEGETMRVHSMSIVVEDRRCNANCPYCISKMTGFDFKDYKEDREKAKDWPPEHKDELDLFALEKAVKFAKQCGVSTILLTGKGEPTLQPRAILNYTKMFNKHFPFIELQTNGMLLLDGYDDWLQEWYSEGLNTIAISVPHYDPKMCGRILSGRRTQKYFNLSKLVDKLKDIGYTVRINCVMFDEWHVRHGDLEFYGMDEQVQTKDDLCGINSMDEVRNFIRFVYDYLEADQLTFTPIRRPVECENEVAERWVEHHEFQNESNGKEFPHNLLKFFRNQYKLLLQLPHGAEVFNYQGHNVCISDCLTLDPDPERIRQLIFFPNGRLCYDWQYPGAVLLAGREETPRKRAKSISKVNRDFEFFLGTSTEKR